MIEELGLINAISRGRPEHWEIKNQPEGLPYNQAIRLRRLITVLALLNETEHKVTGPFAIRELPRMLNKYKELTGENLNTSKLLEARKQNYVW